MNERIKYLLSKSTYEVMGVKQVDQKQFAELIIKECARVLTQHGTYFSGEGEPYHYAASLIEEHFGVDDKSIKVGSRIKVISGFNVGARGIVNYIEPTGRLWVRRDGASSDVYYHLHEIEGVE